MLTKFMSSEFKKRNLVQGLYINARVIDLVIRILEK